MIAAAICQRCSFTYMTRLIPTALLCVVIVLITRTESVRADATPTPTPAHAQSGAQLHDGDTIAGSLADVNTADRFVVFGAYGDLLSVGAFPAAGQSEAPYLEIDAPDGSVAAQSDGLSAGVPGALVSALALPSTGAYIVYVQAADKQALGDYTLSVSGDWILRDFDGGSISLETPAVGTLPRPADRQNWQLRLTANIQFTILAQSAGSGTLDPVIEVLSPFGDRLGVAHDFSPYHRAETDPILAPMSGVYQIRISAYANQSVGAYDLVARALTTP